MAQKSPTIGIIGGQGRMGKLFADFFREHGVKVLVADLKTKLSNAELAQKSDITIVSVPIDQTLKVIEELIPHMPKTSALMDFTSIKVEPVKAMLKAKCEVLGLHPMFGNSNPIPNQTVILTPTRKTGPWGKWLEQFLINHDVKIHKMTPKAHDEMMTVAQGLIHFADIAFVDGLRRTKMAPNKITPFTGKASELKVILAARLINQDPNLYGNIQIQNPRNLKVLKSYQKSIDELIKIIEKKDLKKFTKYFEKNQKFFGQYKKDAYNESGYLIDKLIEKRHRPARAKRPQKASKNAIAVLGPANTFSDAAAEKFLKENQLKKPKFFTSNIEEIYHLVAKGQVDLGIAPIENRLYGSVRESLDALFAQNIHIIEEIELPIEHCLISLKHADPKKITKIMSHPQALSQSKKFLKKHYPKATLEPYSSTAASVDKLLASKKNNIGVVASEIAGKSHPSLKIIKQGIEDNHNNITRFVAIKKGTFKSKNTPKTATKTSIAFHFGRNQPGTLHGVLADFSKHKIDLSKIESRPTQGKFGEYIFFIDFQESITSSKAQKALKSIQSKVAKMKVLGSY
jgi:prephenate dehydrogenase